MSLCRRHFVLICSRRRNVGVRARAVVVVEAVMAGAAAADGIVEPAPWSPQVGGTASLSGAIQRTPHTGRALTDHPEDAFLRAADPRPGRQRNCDPPGTANLSRRKPVAWPLVRFRARGLSQSGPPRSSPAGTPASGASVQHLHSGFVASPWLEATALRCLSVRLPHLAARRVFRSGAPVEAGGPKAKPAFQPAGGCGGVENRGLEGGWKGFSGFAV
jgi:hypothetical protein